MQRCTGIQGKHIRALWLAATTVPKRPARPVNAPSDRRTTALSHLARLAKNARISLSIHAPRVAGSSAMCLSTAPTGASRATKEGAMQAAGRDSSRRCTPCARAACVR